MLPFMNGHNIFTNWLLLNYSTICTLETSLLQNDIFSHTHTFVCACTHTHTHSCTHPIRMLEYNFQQMDLALTTFQVVVIAVVRVLVVVVVIIFLLASKC